MFSTRSRDHEMMKSQDISNLKKRKVATYPWFAGYITDSDSGDWFAASPVVVK